TKNAGRSLGLRALQAAAAISGPIPEGSPMVSASAFMAAANNAAAAAAQMRGSAPHDLGLVPQFLRVGLAQFFEARAAFLRLLLFEDELGNPVVAGNARAADTDELHAALGVAHLCCATLLRRLDGVGPVGRQFGFEHAAEIAHRHVDHALDQFARAFAAAVAVANLLRLLPALGQEPSAVTLRNDEDHLLQHIFGRSRLLAAL